jgi:hypothetical protein
MNALERFDGVCAWSALSPEQQAEIGAIALEYVIARNGLDLYSDVDGAALLHRPFEAVEPLLMQQLLELAQDALADQVPALTDLSRLMPVPSFLGRVCRACACSEYDPCPEGCGWAEPDLCTACAELAQPSASAPQPAAVDR